MRWTDGAVGDTYSIGTGRYDVTGPAAEIELVQPVSRHLLCESSNFVFVTLHTPDGVCYAYPDRQRYPLQAVQQSIHSRRLQAEQSCVCQC